MPTQRKVPVAQDRLSIRFKPRLWGMLEEAAEMEGVAKTEIVRWALSAYLPEVFQRHTSSPPLP